MTLAAPALASPKESGVTFWPPPKGPWLHKSEVMPGNMPVNESPGVAPTQVVQRPPSEKHYSLCSLSRKYS